MYSAKKPITAKHDLLEAIGIHASQTEVIINQDENKQVIMEDIIPDGKGILSKSLER